MGRLFNEKSKLIWSEKGISYLSNAFLRNIVNSHSSKRTTTTTAKHGLGHNVPADGLNGSANGPWHNDSADGYKLRYTGSEDAWFRAERHYKTGPGQCHSYADLEG